MFGFFGNSKLKQEGKESAIYFASIVVNGPDDLDEDDEKFFDRCMEDMEVISSGNERTSANSFAKEYCFKIAEFDNKRQEQIFNLVYKDLICLRMYVIEQMISIEMSSDKSYFLKPFFELLRRSDYSNIIDKNLHPDPGKYLERRYTIFNQYVKHYANGDVPTAFRLASKDITANLISLGGYQKYTPLINEMFNTDMESVIRCVRANMFEHFHLSEEISKEFVNDAKIAENTENCKVITCGKCGAKMRVPLLNKNIEVSCPSQSCMNKFIIYASE